jgi:hypothetical protein
MESATLIPGAASGARPARARALSARLGGGASGAMVAKVALGLLALAALVAYIAFPTYPTYDSFYALLWGRELLHGHVPDLAVYRAPTEHPLAIAFGAFLSLFGAGGARLMIAGSLASFVALVAGVYRLGRVSFGPVVGWLAAALMLTRFFDENLTVQGYLDISYLALIVWALALEVARPRRGPVVFLLLAGAGLLRPDAWVLSGVYWLWCVWPRRDPATSIDNATRLRYLALALLAPAIWLVFDAAFTGDPLHSLHQTTELAGELERTQGVSGVLGSMWSFAVRIDKLPVVLGALAGVVLAVWLTPRRALTPLAALLVLLGVFIVEGALGASVINRYLLGAATVALVFAAVAIGGWSMLERGSRLRLAWMAAAALLVLYGAANVLSTFHVSELSNTMAYHEDFHQGLARALADPKVKRTLARCPVLSLPDNKLVPDARWILGTAPIAVVPRSQLSAAAATGHTLSSKIAAERLAHGSVAVYPLGPAVFFEAIVDPGDDPRDQVPQPGFTRIYTSHYYALYANC